MCFWTNTEPNRRDPKLQVSRCDCCRFSTSWVLKENCVCSTYALLSLGLKYLHTWVFYDCITYFIPMPWLTPNDTLSNLSWWHWFLFFYFLHSHSNQQYKGMWPNTDDKTEQSVCFFWRLISLIGLRVLQKQIFSFMCSLFRIFNLFTHSVYLTNAKWNDS